MVNRTAKPLALSSISEYDALGLKAGDLKPAYLGDGNGNFQVLANGFSTAHYGKYWIRFQSGTDGNGNTAFSQPIPAIRRPSLHVPLRENFPVLVRFQQSTRQWIIAELDAERMAAAGDNPNALNLFDPALWQVWLDKIRNFRLFTVSTDTTPSTLVTIEPLLIHYDGNLHNAGKTTADNVDLSSYIPAVGLERLVVIGVRTHDRSVQIISGSTRSISTTNYSISDVQTLVQQFDDDVMPNRAVRLANAAGQVREKDLYLDLRQFVNVWTPRGLPININRHILITDNYRVLTKATHTVTGDGQLVIEGSGQLVIEDAA